MSKHRVKKKTCSTHTEQVQYIFQPVHCSKCTPFLLSLSPCLPVLLPPSLPPSTLTSLLPSQSFSLSPCLPALLPPSSLPPCLTKPVVWRIALISHLEGGVMASELSCSHQHNNELYSTTVKYVTVAALFTMDELRMRHDNKA